MARHSKYNPEIHALAVEMYAKGATDEQVAKAIEINVSTLYTWKQKYPEFLEAQKSAKDAYDITFVESALLQRALGYSHPEEVIFNYKGEIIRAETIKRYPPDTTALIYWLNNRNPKRWRTMKAVEIEAPNEFWKKLKLGINDIDEEGGDADQSD